MEDGLIAEYWQIFSRMLVVLASSTGGLILGSLIHYAFFEESLIYKGSPTSSRLGGFLFFVSVLIFSLTVYVLYLNVYSPIVVSLIGMLLSKLMWNLGDSFRYASRLHHVLSSLPRDDSPARHYLAKAHAYRQIQDLRSVAQTMYVAGSTQLEKLDELIEEVTGGPHQV